ncbi:hypothetical protein CEXT_741271 [Caerostris extrusa]|uniref:Uncharacterized protein n=1 Tax=Caerostris extrusa TaxID=172846 RepID=A0AAV4P5B5_CAEEX|nr:hypothetical protein CEXT_741271 [Caerostris extrusa]
MMMVHFLKELYYQSSGQDLHDVVLVPMVVSGDHEVAFLQQDAAEEQDCEHGREEEGCRISFCRILKKKT